METTIESQCKRIRKYMESGRSLTGLDALYMFGCWRLLARIDDLKKIGVNIAPTDRLGLKRLGCVGCPQVSKKGQREYEFCLYPKIYNAIYNAIDKGMLKNPQWKISKLTDFDAQKAMDWWLSGKSMDNYFKL
jgi:hypothetical protein